jgi:hypothetical protein
VDYFDALSISLLGVAVVFSGLVLTYAMIWLFPKLSAFVERRAAPASPPLAAPAPPGPPPPPLDPEMLSVLVAVLEIEKRLYPTGPDSRLTIARRRAGIEPAAPA